MQIMQQEVAEFTFMHESMPLSDALHIIRKRMKGWKPKGSKGLCYVNVNKGFTIEQLEQRFGSEPIKRKIA